MDWTIALLLMSAGVLGGIANALAGGATLITFPAMLASGLPPIVANASNAVAVSPGQLIAALTEHNQLPPLKGQFLFYVMAGLVGGTAGAMLLLVTPSNLFALTIPFLIAFATLVFAFSRQLRDLFLRSQTDALIPKKSVLFLVPATIYGGYFGAGLGVLLMAHLSVSGVHDLRQANAMKNLISTAVSMSTVMVFVSRGIVSWLETSIMLVGAVIGGALGVGLIRALPPSIIRCSVIVIGCVMTIVYVVQYWL